MELYAAHFFIRESRVFIRDPISFIRKKPTFIRDSNEIIRGRLGRATRIYYWLVGGVEKIRTRRKVMKRIVDILVEDVCSGELYRVVIIYANREKEAFEWKEKLEPQFPNVEFTKSYFGPVIGTHLGEGARALGLIKK